MGFKALLKEKQVTQLDMAEKLGVHQTLISLWCRGKCKPSISCVKKISELLGASLEEVISCFEENQHS